MTNWNEWAEPSKNDEELCLKSSKAICAEANLLLREGVPEPVLVAGMGAAIADTIASIYGAHAVAPWFQKQADMIRELQSGGH